MKAPNWILFSFIFIQSALISNADPFPKVRNVNNFCKNWKFNLGDFPNANEPVFDDSKWRILNLPHDWSIEGEFSEKNPSTAGGGALPGGIGWYRKTFTIPESEKQKAIFIDFDGVYRNSEVWINGKYLGIRPYGYSSFRYDLTPYLKFGKEKNIIAVKVDNSKQSNSRWYSGSGIYRNVWLVITNKIYVDHWGTFVTTPEVNYKSAKVNLVIKMKNQSGTSRKVIIITTIYDSDNKEVSKIESQANVFKDAAEELNQDFIVNNPNLWSVQKPYLYKALSQVVIDKKVVDDYETVFGIRFFEFDKDKGFLLNGLPVKILGVCNHHDLGCLGSAINTRALERQLEILKDMGCNAIRTSHNPPAPELLDLADKMGFIIMDEAFDMWKKKKTDFDYSHDFDQWHKRDLEDMVLRDRNHPSIFIWSIGNEILEQWDSTGVELAQRLTGIVKNLDSTRPVTSACNETNIWNNIIKSGALDLIGYNYHHNEFADFHQRYPGKKFIGAETTSAIATRGYYDIPSDSIRIWPLQWDKPQTFNSDFTCSAYDNCRVGWGSTHEESWKIIKKYDFLSGMFIWTGFDYLGEPTPYWWPSRSSYFGIVDLAGFPKDAFYMYQSEWTSKPVLHIFPHWNWKTGDTIDIWAYSDASEVELFLNGKSLGVKQKKGDDLHLMWRVPYIPGTIKAISRKAGNDYLVKEIKTAGNAAKIIASADRNTIKADGKDLSFITFTIVDKDGNIVPGADNLVKFKIIGEGKIIGVDNGDQVSHDPFKADYRKAFNGLCLAVLQANEKAGKITLIASSDGLEQATIVIETK